jgi:5-methylcytosine-specific restriction endonuclease McrA
MRRPLFREEMEELARINKARRERKISKSERNRRKKGIRRIKNRRYRKYTKALRRAIEINRLPLWADLKAIQLIYVKCPKGLTVDHIVPLNGNNVSGLHVENNLQYLTNKENVNKGNKYES